MFMALFKLNIKEAFHYNMYMFIVLLLLIPFLIYSSINYIKTGQIKKIPLNIIIIFAIVAVIFMIFRNIPGFEFLRPQKI